MSEKKQNLLDKIVSFCKRRGFIYPSSEIYGGYAAIYDYGPYGVLLENNVKKLWWDNYVQLRDDIVGLDSSIFMNPRIWHASGHVKGFSDPLVECRECNMRSRADKMLEEIGVQADEKMDIKEINEIFAKNLMRIKCPECGASNFTQIKKFNLLVKSNLGSYTEEWDADPSYLRGETCQGIYVNYKAVLDSMRVKIPFGIAQIGKAFRNEITARKFVFRTREFEQMEMQNCERIGGSFLVVWVSGKEICDGNDMIIWSFMLKRLMMLNLISLGGLMNLKGFTPGEIMT
jgi:glycyl-tRNA synthetase